MAERPREQLTKESVAAMAAELRELALMQQRQLQRLAERYGVEDLSCVEELSAQLPALPLFALDKSALAGKVPKAAAQAEEEEEEAEEVPAGFGMAVPRRKVTPTYDISEVADFHLARRRRFTFVPIRASEGNEEGVFMAECAWNATVGHLRRQVARTHRVAPGRVRILRDGKSGVQDWMQLDDQAEAAKARCMVITYLLPRGRRPQGPSVTYEEAHQMLTQLLRIFTDPDMQRELKLLRARSPAPGERGPDKVAPMLLQVQLSVIPQYGFRADAQGLEDMFYALEEWIGCSSLMRLAESVNAAIGHAPQVFEILASQSGA